MTCMDMCSDRTVLSVCMGHSGGDRCLCVWFTVGGPRSPSNPVTLWVIRAPVRARSVANPAVTRGVRQSLWGSQGDQTCCSYEIKCVL